MNIDAYAEGDHRADRLGLSAALDDEALLHRRLVVFYGYFAVLSTLGTLANRTKLVFANVDVRHRVHP